MHWGWTAGGLEVNWGLGNVNGRHFGLRGGT
jgi:hypothetical protein